MTKETGKAAADQLDENQLAKNPQLTKARERTPCTNTAVEKTPGTAKEDLPRESDGPDARADIRGRAREAATYKLAKN